MPKIKTFLPISLFIFFLVFLLTIVQISQEHARNQQPPTSATIGSPRITVNSTKISIDYDLSGSSNLKADSTGIYYSEVSTPSALTHLDSPQAVGYQQFTPDYAFGVFPIPGTYSVTITNLKPQKYYIRGYAHVDGKHLWTAEYPLVVK